MKWLEEYKSSLKMVEVEEVLDLIFYRPLAFLLVKSVYSTGITPDQLTFAAIVSGIISGFFYATGTQWGCVAGAIFFLFFNILDCSDGQLARLKKNGTPLGRILDVVADYIAEISVFTGIAIGFHNHPDQPQHLFILLVMSGLCIILQDIMVDYYRTRFLDYVLERKKTFEEGIDEFEKEYGIIRHRKGKWLEKTVIGIYLWYTALQSSLTLKRKGRKLFRATSSDYYRKNKIIIRFWVLMGPTAQITALIICSIFCRFDIFFWIILGLFNSLALVLRIIQQKIDKNFISVS